MPKNKDLLLRMAANPKADWKISDVKTVYRQNGLTVSPPTRGDHFKIHASNIHSILIIPAHRPIKPVYIRKLVSLIEDSKQRTQEAGGD